MVWHTNTNFFTKKMFSGFSGFLFFLGFSTILGQNAPTYYSVSFVPFWLKFCTDLPLNSPEGMQEPDFRLLFFILKNGDFSLFWRFQAHSRARVCRREKKFENPAPAFPRQWFWQRLCKISEKLKHHSLCNMSARFVICAIWAFWDKCV